MHDLFPIFFHFARSIAVTSQTVIAELDVILIAEAVCLFGAVLDQLVVNTVKALRVAEEKACGFLPGFPADGTVW